jgi:hypothetical protein
MEDTQQKQNPPAPSRWGSWIAWLGGGIGVLTYKVVKLCVGEGVIGIVTGVAAAVVVLVLLSWLFKWYGAEEK